MRWNWLQRSRFLLSAVSGCVVRAAALLGTDFAVIDLAAGPGRSVTDLVPAIDEARAVGVLAEAGDGLGSRHPLIRAALYDDADSHGKAPKIA